MLLVQAGQKDMFFLADYQMRLDSLLFCILLSLPCLLTAGEDTSLWKANAPCDLKIGDMVFRRGHGVWTKYFIDCSSREKRFSHVGIVTGLGSELVLIHADADERTGDGRVRIEGWCGFFANALECAVFRFDGDSSVASNIAINAERRLGVKFDSAFDMGETNRLYCSEMVRLAINEAVGTNLVGSTKVCGRNVVAIDDLYHNGFRRIYDSHHPELCISEAFEEGSRKTQQEENVGSELYTGHIPYAIPNFATLPSF